MGETTRVRSEASNFIHNLSVGKQFKTGVLKQFVKDHTNSPLFSEFVTGRKELKGNHQVQWAITDAKLRGMIVQVGRGVWERV